jgi:hypothetical protein
MVGGGVYAVAGAVMAARNLRWFGWTPSANPLMVWLGLGLALQVAALGIAFGPQILRAGVAGKVAAAAGSLAPLILLLSRLVEFAIFGTLATFLAIAAFTVAVLRHALLPRPDVVLLAFATVASITWNTETASAALLVVVGLIGAWICYRALIAGKWPDHAAAAG